MTCLLCATLDLENKSMAAQHYGHCRHDPNFTFTGISTKKCDGFKEAPAYISEKRVIWAGNKK